MRYDLETRNGETLAPRVWQLLEAAYAAAGIDPARLTVTQGSPSTSVAASGSTHSGPGGGVFDLRTYAFTRQQVEAIVHQLRRRNVAAWYRDKEHGGFSPHIHGVVIDQPGIGLGARQQTAAYAAGRNGLSGSSEGPDYHPRPAQHPYPLPEDDMPTPEEVAAAVWATKTTDPVTGDQVTAMTLLKRVRVNAKQAAATGADPNPEAAATVALIAKELGA